MGDWFSSRSFKILAILLVSALLLLGGLLASLPGAVKKAIVFGGDYALGSGTTSVGKVHFRDVSKVQVEQLVLKNPATFSEGNLLTVGDLRLLMSEDWWLSDPINVSILVSGIDLTIDAAIDGQGLRLNLLDAYRQLKSRLQKKDSTDDSPTVEKDPRLKCDYLEIESSTLTGKIRLPGGKIESISLEIPRIEFYEEGIPAEGQSTAMLFDRFLSLLIESAFGVLEKASEEWEMSQGEREAFRLMLYSWSEEGVSNIVKDRLQGQVKKVLEKRLPSGLKGLLGGEESSED